MEKLGKCLVTGGAGMVGHVLVEQLVEMGLNVRVLDLDPISLECVEGIVGDVADFETVKKACKDIDTVFHVAAQVWQPGLDEKVFEKTNVQGTKNVIRACKECGVKSLVYTSTMDVVVEEPIKSVINGDESLPYPDPLPEQIYPKTKIISEKDVLKANGNGLKTCVLRPCGIYGPRDKYHLPNLIEISKRRMKLKIGDGSAKFQHVYSENVAHAHILAANDLVNGAKAAGECYFITDYEAENFFSFLDPFLRKLGLNPPQKSIPYKVAYFFARIAEKINPKGVVTKFSVAQCCEDITFCSDKAKRDFGYEPIVSKEEAFKKTVVWFKENYPFD